MTDKTSTQPQSPGKPRSTRSPNYPSFNLEAAIAKLPEAFKQMNRHAVGVEVAVKALGLSYKSSSGKLALATMRSFGLFENSGKGMVKISQRGLDIAVDYPTSASEWWTAVKEAALTPKVHRTLWERYKAALPADDEIRRVLIRELKFGDNAVGPLIAEYKATIAFAKLGADDKMPDASDDEDDQDEAEGGEALEDATKGRQERRRRMVAGIKEDVFSLDEGSVILQWPDRLSKASAEDLEDWLALIGRKIKRAAEAPPQPPTDDNTDDE